MSGPSLKATDLEPIASAAFDALKPGDPMAAQNIVLLSIAISLKRIADRTPNTPTGEAH